MIIKKINKNIFVLRIKPNEELFSSILNFAKQNKIKSGFFYGLGACQKCILGRYNEKTKNYNWKKINKQMEIGNLVGNLTIKENEPYLHIHAVLSDKNLKAISGHLKEMIIYPTCEIMFFKFDKLIKRKFNSLTGLYLID